MYLKFKRYRNKNLYILILLIIIMNRIFENNFSLLALSLFCPTFFSILFLLKIKVFVKTIAVSNMDNRFIKVVLS